MERSQTARPKSTKLGKIFRSRFLDRNPNLGPEVGGHVHQLPDLCCLKLGPEVGEPLKTIGPGNGEHSLKSGSWGTHSSTYGPKSST